MLCPLVHSPLHPPLFSALATAIIPHIETPNMNDPTDTRNNGPTTAGRDPQGRFTAGNAGRPRGSRHRATEAVQALLEGQLEQLTQRAISAALEGDTAALRLCLDRLCPPKRETAVTFPLPQLKTAEDASAAAGSVVEAMADGSLTPAEAAHCMAVVETFRRILETTDLERRIAALETKQ